MVIGERECECEVKYALLEYVKNGMLNHDAKLQ